MCESSNRVGKGRSEDIVLDVKCKYLFEKQYFYKDLPLNNIFFPS